MADPTKASATTTTQRFNDSDELRSTYVDRETGETLYLQNKDDAELAFFGKRQRLKRMFGTLSMIGFVSSIMITWAGLLAVFQGGLLNGGPLGLICGFIYVWVGVMAQTLVLAEMGSMIPISGGQYNFVSVLSPPSCRKFLSYLTGWMTMIAWQSLCTSATYIISTGLEGLILLNDPDFEVKNWRTLLIIYAMTLAAIIMNTLLARLLPLTQVIVLFLYIAGFIAILTTLVVLAPHKSPEFVFETFLHGGGYSSNGVTFFLGTTATIFAFIGNDGATHMAEELNNAAVSVPWSMVTSVLFNGFLGVAMLIATMFCIGDINRDFGSAVGQLNFPFLEIFRQAAGSGAGATGMALPVIIMGFMAMINGVTTTSRMIWAFARERGVPGHALISRVHRPTSLPLYAIAVCVLINMLLSLLVFSYTAFGALISITVAGFYSSFLIAACMMFYKRLTTPASAIRWGPFRLGRAGIPVYLYAIAFSLLGFFWSFWPIFNHPSLDQMNWCVVVYPGVLILSMIYWFTWARHVYKGPVIEIDVMKENGEHPGEKRALE